MTLQHRKVKAGFYILLTSYDDLYSDDWILPTGNLRESRSGAKRANVIIVTKCPADRGTKKKNRLKLHQIKKYILYHVTYDTLCTTEKKSSSS
jgi:tetraacyldisaccharide 4'-kinase